MESTDSVRKAVRERYGEAARRGAGCCTSSSSSCCSSSASTRVGYSREQLASLPEGADLGLGCGNPTALASLKPGERVLDLGSGAGIDCFLAADAVGDDGAVIGVDMTAEMIDRARTNAERHGIRNVEFRLGEIEHLPVADEAIDVILSNCVVNLSPDKPQVFREAFRVLSPGGRLMISDIVQLKPLPAAIKRSIEAYVGCVAGASMKGDYLDHIRNAGFERIEIVAETPFSAAFPTSPKGTIVFDGEEIDLEALGLTLESARDLAGTIASISVRAIKP